MEYELHLLKVPIESILKDFRTHQRNIEKDFLVVENAVKALALREKDCPNVQNTCGSIDKIITKLRGVKRKLHDFETQNVYYEQVQARLVHLHQYQPSNACVFGHPYNMARVNRILVDYLLRRGYVNTATALAERHDMDKLVDIELFKSSLTIADSLRARSCTEALAWCKDNQARLKRLKSPLEVRLRMQEFIELVLNGKKLAALEYARKHLAPHAELHLDQIKFSMAVLCYDPSTPCPKYKEVVDGSRWARLAEEFQQTLLAVYQLPPLPILHIVLQAGILALNTQQAYQTWSYNVNDPMCNKVFQQLARKLPLTCKKNSSLVCRISGAVMDGNNLPMVLPNGQVYSSQALMEMNDILGCIVCPATQAQFRLEECKKAFVL